MAQKLIVWSKLAEEELKFFLEFYTIRNGNPDFSLKLLHQIEQIVALLPKNNFLGRLSDNGFTRVIVKKDFLIFYEVYRNTIVVVSFYDSRQDPSKRIDKKN